VLTTGATTVAATTTAATADPLHGTRTTPGSPHEPGVVASYPE
jgi:hypothetical protein